MTRQEVEEHLCITVALAYRSVGDYDHASDGFCQKCFNTRSPMWNFSHQGFSLEFVRTAVVEKLQRDGYELDKNIAKELGLEVNNNES